MIQNMTRLFILILTIPLLVADCNKDPVDEVFFNEDLIDIAAFLEENKETYSRFYTIMIEGGLEDPLSSYDPFSPDNEGKDFTLFLPTDEAFDRYIQDHADYGSFEELLGDNDFVRVLGRYHIVTMGLETNEFPYGALPDTTATGDLLTIGFSSDLDSTVYKVNNVAPVIQGNLEMVNGYIHVISEVLQPVDFSGYEWLEKNPGYSILAGALEVTGIKDTLGLYKTNSQGQVVANTYTILAEHDSIYGRNNIHSIDDLIETYSTPGLELSDPDNPLYQFAAYHILDAKFFLVDFEQSGNYNTYANSPVRISVGLEIQINPGVDTFRLEIDEYGDTTAIDFITLFYQESNILTKNGAIHLLTQLMEYYTPRPSETTFNFYNDQAISGLRNTQNFSGCHPFYENKQDELEKIQWTGSEILWYCLASDPDSEPAQGGDYIELEGNFTIHYTIPRILAGKYSMYLRAHGYNTSNEHATVIVYFDGKRMGNSFNLNSGGISITEPYKINNNNSGYRLGSVELTKYQEHIVTIETLVPGILRWDNISFKPE